MRIIVRLDGHCIIVQFGEILVVIFNEAKMTLIKKNLHNRYQIQSTHYMSGDAFNLISPWQIISFYLQNFGLFHCRLSPSSHLVAVTLPTQNKNQNPLSFAKHILNALSGKIVYWPLLFKANLEAEITNLTKMLFIPNRSKDK